MSKDAKTKSKGKIETTQELEQIYAQHVIENPDAFQPDQWVGICFNYKKNNQVEFVLGSDYVDCLKRLADKMDPNIRACRILQHPKKETELSKIQDIVIKGEEKEKTLPAWCYQRSDSLHIYIPSEKLDVFPYAMTVHEINGVSSPYFKIIDAPLSWVQQIKQLYQTQKEMFQLQTLLYEKRGITNALIGGYDRDKDVVKLY